MRKLDQELANWEKAIKESIILELEARFVLIPRQQLHQSPDDPLSSQSQSDPDSQSF